MEALSKIKKWIMIVLVLTFLAVFFFLPAVRSWLLAKVESLLSDSKAKDAELSKGHEEAQKQIDEVDKKIQLVDQQIADLSNSEDVDWYKKK